MNVMQIRAVIRVMKVTKITKYYYYVLEHFKSVYSYDFFDSCLEFAKISRTLQVF